MKKNIWLDGVMGVVVGDALGLPVQFLSREEIKERPEGPVTGMESGGTYAMPIGAWSDDSSMSIATMASILDKGEMDLADIMMQFVKWELKGEYTPTGESFDQGNTCSTAIYNFIQNPDVRTCGKTGEYANGNGALMRIMPACLYYYCREKKVSTSDVEAIESIHKICGLTHNHLRSKICCGVYYFCVKSIIDGLENYESRKEQWDSQPEGFYGLPIDEPSLIELLQRGIDNAKEFYKREIGNLTELSHLGRLFDLSEFEKETEDNIRSSGYVIDSIEAAFWSLITTGSYKECLLKAVNLGDDTDTIGAIAGGLAGLYYGYENTPSDWLSVILRREWIEDMCKRMNEGAELIDVPIVDIHTHCLFNVDDGAKTPEMAMEMIRSLYLQGVRHIFCTSHDIAFDDNPDKASDAYRELKCRCASVMPDLNLYTGCEVYVEPGMMPNVIAGLKTKVYPSLNNTDYVLIELPTMGINLEQVKYCVEVLTGAGWKPILAHCERYAYILNGLEDIRALKDMGCLVQVNAYSLVEETNKEMREFANAIADAKLIDFLGTDAHRMKHRNPRMIKGVKEIYRRFNKEYADAICYNNAFKYLGIRMHQELDELNTINKEFRKYENN